MSEFQQFKVEAPAGVNFAREPSQLNPMLWDNAENVTFRYGITKKCSGYEEGFGQSHTLPECIVPLRDDTQNFYWWAYAGNKVVENTPGVITNEERIYRITARGIHQDVTPTGGINIETPILTDLQWTGDTLNAIPYLCKDKPYVWDPGTSKFRLMNGFPKHLHFKTMRTYRNFMIGLNFSTDDFSGDFDTGFGPWNSGHHQNALWWSHDVTGTQLDSVKLEEGGYSKSMWCDADPVRNSGWNYLGGAGGPIVDGRALRDGFIIYRERSVWQMTYTGGINVFAFKELFDDAGALSLDCIAEVEGQHFVIGQSDVYMHNGVQKRSVADGVVRQRIFNSIDPEHIDKVFVTVSYKDKELWVCIPEATTNIGGACNIAFVYNWEDQTWSQRDIPDLVCASYTILSIPEEDMSWNQPRWGGPLDPEGNGVAVPGGTWEQASGLWIDSYFKYNPSQWGLALGSARTKDPTREDSWNDDGDWDDITSWDEDAVTVEGSRYYIYTSIEEPLYNGRNSTGTVEKKWMTMNDRTDSSFINKVYPLVRKGIVDVYMAGSTTVDAAFSWKYLGRFDPDRDTKLSCRISGEFVHIKFVIPETSRAEIRGYWLEYGKIGRRA